MQLETGIQGIGPRGLQRSLVEPEIKGTLVAHKH